MAFAAFALASLMLSAPLSAPVVAATVDEFPGEWVQLTFEGRIEPVGGAPIELVVGALIRSDDSMEPVRDLARGLPVGEGREVALRPHLAQGTSASDIAALLARHLERAGADVWLSEPDEPSASGRRHLFVERALLVRMRLGQGLSAEVTVCEGAPDAVKIEPPTTTLSAGRLVVAYTSLHPHTRSRSRGDLEMTFEPSMHPSAISERLASYCLGQGMIAERPQLDSWRVVKLGDGAQLVGFNIRLETAADWTFELRFRR